MLTQMLDLKKQIETEEWRKPAEDIWETSHLTSMDWTPSDSSSMQLLFSRGPSMMTGASAGVAASSSEGTTASALMSDTANTQCHFKEISSKFIGGYYNRGAVGQIQPAHNIAQSVFIYWWFKKQKHFELLWNIISDCEEIWSLSWQLEYMLLWCFSWSQVEFCDNKASETALYFLDISF